MSHLYRTYVVPHQNNLIPNDSERPTTPTSATIATTTFSPAPTIITATTSHYWTGYERRLRPRQQLSQPQPYATRLATRDRLRLRQQPSHLRPHLQTPTPPSPSAKIEITPKISLWQNNNPQPISLHHKWHTHNNILF